MTHNYKRDFPIFQHTDVAYIDNAATAQRPQCVLDAVADFYRWQCQPAAGFLICTSVPGNLRSEDPENLAAAALKAGWTQEKVKIIPDPREALFEAEKTGKGTVCCGSLYFVGHMRTMLFSNRKELGF